jgi:hypothetical protein
MEGVDESVVFHEGPLNFTYMKLDATRFRLLRSCRARGTMSDYAFVKHQLSRAEDIIEIVGESSEVAFARKDILELLPPIDLLLSAYHRYTALAVICRDVFKALPMVPCASSKEPSAEALVGCMLIMAGRDARGAESAVDVLLARYRQWWQRRHELAFSLRSAYRCAQSGKLLFDELKAKVEIDFADVYVQDLFVAIIMQDTVTHSFPLNADSDDKFWAALQSHVIELDRELHDSVIAWRARRLKPAGKLSRRGRAAQLHESVEDLLNHEAPTSHVTYDYGPEDHEHVTLQ